MSLSGKEACKRPEVREAKIRAVKTRWQDPEQRERHSQFMYEAWAEGIYDDRADAWDEERRHKKSEQMKEKWQDPEFAQMMIEACAEAIHTEEAELNKSRAMLALWQDSEYRQKVLEARRIAWEKPENRQRHLEMLQAMFEDPEWRRKNSEARKGDKNPAWQGGISFAPYDPDFNDELKRYIRERDGYRCSICGISEDGQPHDCHHIDYNKLNSLPENLLTLCKSCHGKTGHNRRFWRTILQPIATKREGR